MAIQPQELRSLNALVLAASVGQTPRYVAPTAFVVKVQEGGVSLEEVDPHTAESMAGTLIDAPSAAAAARALLCEEPPRERGEAVLVLARLPAAFGRLIWADLEAPPPREAIEGTGDSLAVALLVSANDTFLNVQSLSQGNPTSRALEAGRVRQSPGRHPISKFTQ